MTSPAVVEGQFDAGYALGWVERGRHLPSDDHYVPQARAWRHVQPGDTIRSPDRRLWTVEDIGPNARRRVQVRARCGTAVMAAGYDNSANPAGLDPDDLVLVLEAGDAARAEQILRDGLGSMRTLERTPTPTPEG